jgi:hypothetical protein
MEGALENISAIKLIVIVVYTNKLHYKCMDAFWGSYCQTIRKHSVCPFEIITQQLRVRENFGVQITLQNFYCLKEHFNWGSLSQRLVHKSFSQEYDTGGAKGLCCEHYRNGECRLLGCDAVWLLLELTFRGNVSPSLSQMKESASLENLTSFKNSLSVRKNITYSKQMRT